MAFDILAHSNIGDIIQKQRSLKQISTAPSLTLISSEYGTSWTWLISTILGAIIISLWWASLLAIIKSTSWLDSWCWGQCNSLFIAGHVTQYHVTVPQREGREGEGVGSGQSHNIHGHINHSSSQRPGLPWPWCWSAECPRRWRTARPGPWPMRREYKELWQIRRQHEWHQVAGNEMNCLPDTLLVW